MSNNFKEDLFFGTNSYRSLLDAFYRDHSYQGRHVFVNKSRFSDLVQKKLKVDTVMQRTDDKSFGLEEKIVRWPTSKDRPHTAFCLETRSCTNPGHESKGWMETCRADYLLYGFETKNYELQIIGLDVYIIDFPRLQKWFYAHAFSNPRYRFHTMSDENRTESKLVDIRDVDRNVSTSRHFIFLNGDSQRLATCIDARALVTPTVFDKDQVNAFTLPLVKNLLPKSKRRLGKVDRSMMNDLFNSDPVQQQVLWEEVRS